MPKGRTLAIPVLPRLPLGADVLVTQRICLPARLALALALALLGFDIAMTLPQPCACRRLANVLRTLGIKGDGLQSQRACIDTSQP